MAGVSGEYRAAGYDLPPGKTDPWIMWGGSFADTGVVHTFYVEPINALFPWEQIFEVTYVAAELGADGARRCFVNVTNQSPADSEYASYQLIHCWTDKLV